MQKGEKELKIRYFHKQFNVFHFPFIVLRCLLSVHFELSGCVAIITIFLWIKNKDRIQSIQMQMNAASVGPFFLLTKFEFVAAAMRGLPFHFVSFVFLFSFFIFFSFLFASLNWLFGCCTIWVLLFVLNKILNKSLLRVSHKIWFQFFFSSYFQNFFSTAVFFSIENKFCFFYSFFVTLNLFFFSPHFHFESDFICLKIYLFFTLKRIRMFIWCGDSYRMNVFGWKMNDFDLMRCISMSHAREIEYKIENGDRNLKRTKKKKIIVDRNDSEA